MIFDGPKVQAVGPTLPPGPPHNGPSYATWERTLRGQVSQEPLATIPTPTLQAALAAAASNQGSSSGGGGTVQVIRQWGSLPGGSTFSIVPTEILNVVNRPGVAGAVLHTPKSLID